METSEELRTFLSAATQEAVWGRLLYRGAAWSLMRTDGVLPAGAPALGATIETDLAEHGFAVLRGAMALRAREGSSDLSNKAFEQAGKAFEALIRNADPDAVDRGFRRTIAAAAYHLAGYSAVAYSLFNEASDDLNAAPGETAVRFLILRDLGRLRAFVRDWLLSDAHSDAGVSSALRQDQLDLDEAVALVLNTTICRALAFFDFALQTGELEPMATARQLLATAVRLADSAENVPLWWLSNLCRHLIDDLWAHALHENLPLVPPEGATPERYAEMRRLFIASLYARKTAEIELWPSQREAARRSTGIDSANERLGNLNPGFPGMGNQNPFRCRFEVEAGATRTVLNKDVKAIKAIPKHPDAVRAAVDMFIDQARALLEGSSRPEVIMLALPKPIIEKVVNASAFPEDEIDEEDDRDEGPNDLNFRDLFKARGLALNVPTQIAWPTLWDDAAKISRKMKATDRRVQDPATRAWNILNAMFYKAGKAPCGGCRAPKTPMRPAISASAFTVIWTDTGFGPARRKCSTNAARA